MLPAVSVCIPTFNRRDLLEKTLESLNKQTFQDFELIVGDDASTDRTGEFLCSLGWSRLKVIRNSRNLNLAGNLARLFREARGKYIGMQHDHDLYEPQFLEKMVDLMERNPSAGFGCCAYHILNTDGTVIRDPAIMEYRLYKPYGVIPGKEMIRILATRVNTPVPAMSTIFRREIVEKAGGYLPDWNLAADEDLYRRVASFSGVAFCPERLFLMRVRPPDRRYVLGGWKGLYNVYELRVDTTEKYFPGEPLFRITNKAHLTANLYKGLLIESVSLWFQGEVEHLAGALNYRTIRSGKSVLHSVPRAVVRACHAVFHATPKLGRILGDAWQMRGRVSRFESRTKQEKNGS